MGKKSRIPAILFGFLLLSFSITAAAGGMMRLSSVGADDGDYADLVIRKVTVTPIRAHAGDPIRIEVVWMYWGEMTNNYFEATSADVIANGRVVASIPFDYRFGAGLGDEYRHTFLWDTRGVPAGEYRIRAEVPLRLDVTPYDNYLDLKEPLVLYPAGAAVPGEKEPGGSAVTENRYWKWE